VDVGLVTLLYVYVDVDVDLGAALFGLELDLGEVFGVHEQWFQVWHQGKTQSRLGGFEASVVVFDPVQLRVRVRGQDFILRREFSAVPISLKRILNTRFRLPHDRLSNLFFGISFFFLYKLWIVRLLLVSRFLVFPVLTAKQLRLLLRVILISNAVLNIGKICFLLFALRVEQPWYGVSNRVQRLAAVELQRLAENGSLGRADSDCLQLRLLLRVQVQGLLAGGSLVGKQTLHPLGPRRRLLGLHG